jgi:filamentous hemagglutinin family protein
MCHCTILQALPYMEKELSLGVLPSVCTVLLSLRRLLCLSGLLLSMLPLRSQAQISLDGSLGPRGALTGPNYIIPAAVGQIRGPNLFHSFDQFNLRPFQGESATFTGPNTITNILSRVTGGSPSIIDGLLRSQIPGGHLYLFNPSGVVFGPNASLDVSGSLHVSTADYMRLADGARFSAHLSETSTLSVAPPAAFGFLGPSLARIDILGSTLEVSAGQTLSVVGGDIGTTSVLSTPKLSAPAGRIHLVSVASSGEVVFDSTGQDPAPQVTSFARLGAINLQEARLDVSGDRAGTVVIRGGRLLVANASITAITGDRDGANMGIDLRLAEDVVVDNSIIRAGSMGRGNVGEIRAEAGTLTLTMGAVISSQALGSGKGGNITVSARESVSISGQNDQGVSSGITTFAAADPGRLSLSAPNVTINNGGVVGTPRPVPEEFVGERVGDIVVKADNLTLAGGRISAETDGTGRAGDILIDAGQLTLTRGALINSNSSSRATGAAGTIQITSTTMDMRGDAFIKSDTFDGPGGTIRITADTLSMREMTGPDQPGSPMITVATQGRGNAGDIVIEGRQVALTGNTILIDSSTSVGSGRGGTVTIHATDSITLAGRRDMEPSRGFVPGFVEGSFGITSNAGQGDGGKVSIRTSVLTMTEGMVITTSTGGDGRAGDIKITVDRLSLTGGSQINSSSGNVLLAPDRTFLVSAGTGNAGTVKVTATDAIFIAGRDSIGIASSGIATTTRGSGQAGRVEVATPQLLMADGGQITAETQGAGRGGDVVVQVGRLSLTGGAQIRSDSVRGETLRDMMTREPIPGQGTGPGGTVTVTAMDTVSIAGRSSTGSGVSPFSNDASSGLFSTTQGPGAAGEIVVSALTLTMSDGGKISVSTTGAGRAGDITVHSGNLTLTGGALIDSSTAEAGRGGVVTVTARETLRIAGQGSGLFAKTSGQGQGGDLTLQAHQLQLSDGAAITADSTGAGNAGSVTITANDVVQNTQSSVTTNTGGSGDAGLVSLTAPTIEVTDGRISAGTRGTGKAGNVVVNVGRLTLNGQAQIDSSSRGAGQGGSVTVTATDTLAFAGPGGLLSNAAGSGAAGTVSVMAPALRMDHAATIKARTTGDGHAGNVEVHVGQLTVLGARTSAAPVGWSMPLAQSSQARGEAGRSP